MPNEEGMEAYGIKGGIKIRLEGVDRTEFKKSKEGLMKYKKLEKSSKTSENQ